jgi:ribose-phosphate pyrophosphokinase
MPATARRGVGALQKAGAGPEISVASTHGLFIEDAHDRIAEAGVRAIFITDSVPQASPKEFVQVVSVAPLLAAAMERITADGSISDLYSAAR